MRQDVGSSCESYDLHPDAYQMSYQINCLVFSGNGAGGCPENEGRDDNPSL